MKKPSPDWPPPYTIRLSARSKRMALRITAQKGLEIIIPPKTSQQRAIAFLNEKYHWVQKYQHLLKSPQPIHLPDHIELHAIDECWTLRYGQHGLAKNCMSSDATQTLLIKNDKSAAALPIVREWLREKAKYHLGQLLDTYSNQYNLPFTSFRVGFQKRRWGSCSRSKEISLNCKLLLMPLELTHYVIVHELVHTIHFDHSANFWSMVEKILPNQLQIRHTLKKIEGILPNWLY